jgi:peptidyl-prolyl cis-trans isomerase SurA
LKISIKAVLIILLALSSAAFSQKEGDRIIAIVGNEAILESDLNFQIISYMKQNNLADYNQEIIETVFQQMITEKLILAKAEQDSIFVSTDELQKQVDNRLKQLVDQFGSEKNLEQAYGITISKVKNILKEQIEQNIKVEKVKQEKFGSGVNVSRSEVIKFYNTYKDSLPPVPESFDLRQIVRVPKITEEARQQAKVKAMALLDSIKAGKDFSEMARLYSEDPGSAAQGGMLGKSKRGSFVKEFEDAAFLLNPGEVSDIVESEFGYHIIKLIEKSGDFITAQHILIKFPRVETADFEEINFLKGIKLKILNNETTFKLSAVKYSQESKSAADSGFIGKIGINELDSMEIIALKNLDKGDISDPVKVGDDRYYAYYLYLVEDRIAEHKADIKEDYKLIENFTLNFKQKKLLNDWIDELKKTIYVDIKI